MSNEIELGISKKLKVVEFRSSTTIGIASEILRLALARAVLLDENILLIHSRWKSLFRRGIYPSIIYKAITAARVGALSSLPPTTRYFWILSRLLMRLRHYAHFKFISNDSVSVGQDGLYTESPELFNKISESRTHHGTLRLVARSIRGFGAASLKDEYAKRCTNRLKELGIEPNNWFVCLHVRTSAFHGDTADYRNADFENYQLAINHVIYSGGIVIRLGDSVPNLINSPRLGLIDYPNTNFKSELMDLFLISGCRFFIGTLSGVLDTAYLMGKPTLCVNSIHFDLRSANPCDLVLYKRIRKLGDSRYLTFTEALENCSDILASDWHLRYEFIENSNEDILKALIEFISISDGSWSVTQRQVKARRRLVRERLRYVAKHEHVYSMLTASIAFSRCQIADFSLIDDIIAR